VAIVVKILNVLNLRTGVMDIRMVLKIALIMAMPVMVMLGFYALLIAALILIFIERFK
jgi:hypothetical protein